MSTKVRYVNIALGSWLVMSAFLWPHTSAQFTNTWLVGMAATMAAGIAIADPRVRYVNTLLAFWLIASLWVFPEARATTVVNNVVVAVAMLTVSIVRNRADRSAVRPVADPTRDRRPFAPSGPARKARTASGGARPLRRPRPVG